MEQNQKEGTNLPVSGIGAAVAALIIGFLFVYYQPLKSSRPEFSDQFSHKLTRVQDVQARLWEDPFTAIQRHRNSIHDEEGENKNTQHSLDTLTSKINEKSYKVTILGMMVSGSPYDELTEVRIRRRYAILSALNVMKYTPSDSQHIGYVYQIGDRAVKYCDVPSECHSLLKCYDLLQRFGDFPQRCYELPLLLNDDPSISCNLLLMRCDNLSLPEYIPYEWFKDKGNKESLLLLWLDNDFFAPFPLDTLNTFLGKIKAKVINNDLLDFIILGPADSDSLKKMIQEMLSSTAGNKWKYLEGIKFFSPTATADDEFLFERFERLERFFYDQFDQFLFVQFVREDPDISLLFAYSVTKSKFLRTIGTDMQLTDALVNELELRGIKQHCDKDKNDELDYIILISEWDTIYGRLLPETFKKSVIKKCYETKHKWIKEPDLIYNFSYLWGIDGQLPALYNKSESETSPLKNKKEEKKEGIERPLGYNQFDYVRRLSFRLKEFEAQKKGKIRAIGVLGSDVYDKLLILQALRPQFRDVIFFTTDLDASLSHPDEYKYTHNLIIASHFGLELNEKLQKDIPPFRNSYQTSVFLTTLIALGSDNNKLTHNNIMRLLHRPRIYEIGRSGPFELWIPDKKNKQEKTYPIKFNFIDHELPTIQPNEKPPSPGSSKIINVTLLMIFIILLTFVSLKFYKMESSNGKKEIFLLQLINIFEVLLIVLFISFVSIVIYIILIEGKAEPFAFFEGISIWPTEIIRLVAGSMSLFFIFRARHLIIKNDKELKDDFLKDNLFQSEKEYPSHYRKQFPKEVVASSLWNNYEQKTGFWRILSLTVIQIIIYAIIIYIIFSIFGFPHVPYRGETSYLINLIILFITLALMFYLNFFIINTTKVSADFIKKLSKDITMWPPGIYKKFSYELIFGEICLSDWIDMKFIEKFTAVHNKILYYPIYVMLLMLLARLSYFDNWVYPFGLVIVNGANLLFAICCIFILGRTANKSRNFALKRLHDRFINAKGNGEEKLAGQISHMILCINSLREGAFTPFWQKSWVHAILMLLSGGGGLILFEILKFR